MSASTPPGWPSRAGCRRAVVPQCPVQVRRGPHPRRLGREWLVLDDEQIDVRDASHVAARVAPEQGHLPRVACVDVCVNQLVERLRFGCPRRVCRSAELAVHGLRQGEYVRAGRGRPVVHLRFGGTFQSSARLCCVWRLGEQRCGVGRRVRSVQGMAGRRMACVRSAMPRSV